MTATDAHANAAKRTERREIRPCCTCGVVRNVPGALSTPERSSPHVFSKLTVAWKRMPDTSPIHHLAMPCEGCTSASATKNGINVAVKLHGLKTKNQSFILSVFMFADYIKYVV